MEVNNLLKIGKYYVLFEVQTRKPDNSLLSEWEPVENGEFVTEDEAINSIKELVQLDIDEHEWATADYRVHPFLTVRR